MPNLNEELWRDIYRLLLFYKHLRLLLESFFSGYLMVRDDELNRNYLRLCNKIADILKKPGFENLANYDWLPFDNLIGIDEDADIDWECGIRQMVGKFYSTVEAFFILGGEKKYPLESDDQQLLDTVKSYLEKYSIHKKVIETKWEQNIEKSAEDFKKRYGEPTRVMNNKIYPQVANLIRSDESMDINKSQLIKELISQARNLPLRDEGRLDALLRRAEMIIRRVFGDNSKYLDDLKTIQFYPNFAPVDEDTEITFWESGQRSLINLFQTMIDELTLFNSSTETKRKIPPEKIAIGSIANFFGQMSGNQRIDKILEPFGFVGLEGNKTQKIGQVLNSFFDDGDRYGIFTILSALLKNHNLSESDLKNFETLIAPLGFAIEEENLVQKEGNFPITIKKYIAIRELPSDFYYELIRYINTAYSCDIFPAVRILNRKLLENLIIDLLRKRFGMKEIELFYDTKNRRFHGFNILLKNMEEKLDDLSPVSTAIDKDFIKLVNKFRVSGNSSAHTIELRISREELEAEKEDLIYLVKVLSKAIMSLP